MTGKKKTPKGWVSTTLFMYFLLSCLLIVVLMDYVKPDPEEYVSYLSYFIYLIGLIGLNIFYKYYSRLHKERFCADRALKQSEDMVKEVKKGLEYELEQFQHLGTDDEKLAVNRMIDHVRREAESKKFESSLFIMNSFKEEFAAETVRLFGFQKVALQLGILGTFIGLAMAFKELSGPAVNEQAMDHLLKSLKIPFSTSIAGLQVAFILWLHLDYLQRKQEQLFRVMEKCMDSVVHLARHAIYKGSITLELQQVNSKMEELSGRTEKTNELLQSQQEQINIGVNRLRTANTDLDAFLQQMGDRQQQFLDKVRSLYDSLDPDAISRELKASLSNGAKEISGVMGSHLESTLARYSALDKSMVAMNENFNNLVNMQKNYVEQLSKTDMRQQVKEVLASSAQAVTKELKTDFERLIPVVSALTRELEAYNIRMTPGIRKNGWQWTDWVRGKIKWNSNGKS